MTIRVNITQKDLLQKIQICYKLIKYFNIAIDYRYEGKEITTSKFYEKLDLLSYQIDNSGHFEEIYQDLQHIEMMLLEKI